MLITELQTLPGSEAWLQSGAGPTLEDIHESHDDWHCGTTEGRAQVGVVKLSSCVITGSDQVLVIVVTSTSLSLVYTAGLVVTDVDFEVRVVSGKSPPISVDTRVTTFVDVRLSA